MKRSSQNIMIGILLVVFGLVAWLNLWWALLPAALIIGSVYGYAQRRNQGKTAEAVQLGLWGIGLGVLFLLNFFWPGVLLLLGASMLVRGREHTIAEFMPLLAGRVLRMRPHLPRRAKKSQDVPISVETPVQYEVYKPSVNETTRL